MTTINKPLHILISDPSDCTVARRVEQMPGNYVNTPAALPLSPSTILEHGHLADDDRVTITVMLTIDQTEFMTDWNNSPDGPTKTLSRHIIGDTRATEVTWEILGVSSTNHDDFVLLVTLSVA